MRINNLPKCKPGRLHDLFNSVLNELEQQSTVFDKLLVTFDDSVSKIDFFPLAEGQECHAAEFLISTTLDIDWDRFDDSELADMTVQFQEQIISELKNYLESSEHSRKRLIQNSKERFAEVYFVYDLAEEQSRELIWSAR